MYRQYYQRFLSANKDVQHFSCHSHHYWPDVTRDAMLEYWDDCAKYVDEKWSHFFQHKIPQTQRLIAENLNISNPSQITFAPNTHEFVFRLLSCLDLRKPQRIITTDSEFHTFQRQIKRLNEWENIEVIAVPQSPVETFESRFCEALHEDADLVFFSHVFFNSGHICGDLDKIVNHVKNSDTIVAIDGYHGFMAIPTDLGSIENRVFYIAGGYKYAQGGEGCCFITVPTNCALRPLYTGWFAEFDALAAPRSAQVAYSSSGYRFAGATMDYSAIYRLHAVLSLFKKEGICVSQIHEFIQQRQQLFLAHIDTLDHPYLNRQSLLYQSAMDHGHFLTFVLPSVEIADQLQQQLNTHMIQTDCRGDRLRFGFALYHDGDYDLRQAFS